MIEHSELTPAWRSSQDTNSALLKSSAEDFVVSENLGYTPTGSGEHAFIYCEKKHLNSSDVIDFFRTKLKLKAVDVSLSGRKDKQAVTRQWIGIRTDKTSTQLQHLVATEFKQATAELKILQYSRNIKKLRTGDHISNHFEIILRQFLGDKSQLEARLQQIRQHGFPNYYGAQRFGYNGSNLNGWQTWVDKGMPRIKRGKRSLFISAARSYLFNCALAQRVSDGSWRQHQTAEYFTGRSDHKAFIVEQLTEAQKAEALRGDIGAALMLPGIVKWPVSGEVLASDPHPWVQALAALKVERGFRRIAMLVPDLCWQWLSDTELRLTFSLARGAFATTLINELVDIHE